MGVTTLGSLREPIPSCREAMEGETMAFSCPEGFTINSVVAYYLAKIMVHVLVLMINKLIMHILQMVVKEYSS